MLKFQAIECICIAMKLKFLIIIFRANLDSGFAKFGFDIKI